MLSCKNRDCKVLLFPCSLTNERLALFYAPPHPPHPIKKDHLPHIPFKKTSVGGGLSLAIPLHMRLDTKASCTHTAIDAGQQFSIEILHRVGCPLDLLLCNLAQFACNNKHVNSFPSLPATLSGPSLHNLPVEERAIAKGNQRAVQTFKCGHQNGSWHDLCNNKRNRQDCIRAHSENPWTFHPTPLSPSQPPHSVCL